MKIFVQKTCFKSTEYQIKNNSFKLKKYIKKFNFLLNKSTDFSKENIYEVFL
jgi:hypothetical protein